MKMMSSATHSVQFINKMSDFFSFDFQFSMDNYRGLIQDMSPQDREVNTNLVLIPFQSSHFQRGVTTF